MNNLLLPLEVKTEKTFALTRMWKYLLLFFILFVSALCLAAFPLFFRVEGEVISFDWEPGMEAILQFLTGTDGHAPGSVRDLTDYSNFGEMFGYSAFTLWFAGTLVLLVGVPAGMFFSKISGWPKSVVGFLGIIPDFVLAIFLQLVVILIYRKSGILVLEVASVYDQVAWVLPMVTLTLVPLVYLVQFVSGRTRQILTEDFIRTAKAKGLSRIKIYMHHVFRNLLPSIRGQLHQLNATLLGNLLIIEYWFNSPGITRFLDTRDYYYPLMAKTLICLILIYWIAYGWMRLLLWLIGKRLAHD
ncbi:oligopeptide ABC superfamily ATP binding cassette transporter permease protein [Desmospora sp. 8437]|nr:oligopeptide ABC superfamily ATP binding cassette transporter permease protein [Desmospora sp. 8437]